jgi:serine/arginine repetitive matrix protein 2
MVRRGSQSSVASGSIVGSGLRGGVGRGGLSRNNSNGSMSERTFRSPSPGRSNGAIPAAQEAPPVPALPASMRGHHRSASTEPPQRMMSPTPRGKNRGVSVDRAGSALANSARRNTRLSDVAETVERQGSTGSINYSRPMSGLGHSPIAAPKATKTNGSWFTAPTGTLSEKPLARPATADGYRSQDARNVQSDIAAAANRPTKKKQIAQSTQGTHLARANDTSHSSFDEPPADPVMVYDPASRTFVARARPAAAQQQPPSPTIPTPAGPKPGEYDPSTRKIVPAIPSQQPSVVVNAGQNPARRAKPAVAAVDTKAQPPPRNSARSDTSSSPVSPRAAGILSKQPSIVREDPEGEQEAETTTATRLNARKTNGFTGFSKTTMRPGPVTPASPIRTRNRSESLDVPHSGPESNGRARGNSYSPSRSARFSASPIVEFTRHDPPERGVSPAKSAMKHSPGSSLRGTSPMNLGASPASKAMSDTSDTPSVEGSGKKKKSVRVSFTDQAPNAEPPVTPAFRAAAARKVSPLIDDDMEEIMKPRPDLPSFGSVRPSRVQQEVAEKVTERPPDRREPSSDRAIGGVLSHNAAKSKPAGDPVPPEVTSKSRPSYSSDESEDEAITASELDAGDATAKAVSSQAVGSVPPPLDLEKKESDVSDIKISLQPPTPGEEETTFEEAVRAESPPPRSSLEKFVVPGGWAPDADDNVPKPAPATAETSHSKVKSASDDAGAVPASGPEGVAGHAPPEVQLSDIAESDSDNSAVFSDAEEDLSYMDESGFASMDAIVESPVVKPKKDAGPESPSLRQAARRTSKEESRAPPDDWSHATSYWKQLSKQQREQIERSHLSSDEEFTPTANSLANRPKKKKSALKQSAPAAPAAYTMPAQPTKTSMRKSMRGPPEPAPTPTTNTVHMRSSLREGGGGGMRTSMRDRPQSEYTASKPAERRNHRPTSSASNLPLAAAGGAMSRRPQSPDEISQDGPFPKMQQRQQQAQTNGRLAKKVPPPPAPANDSDSESSFKKKRRPSQSNMDASGRYAMKRSMRAGSFDDSQHQQRPISPLPPATRKAFSVRSLSPTGSFFGRKQLKESMRAPPADSGAKTLRGPNSMGGKASKAQRKPPPAPRQTSSTSNMASKFKSKFADSDDSDDDDRSRGQKPSFFRSRFADSDDDEPSSRTVIPADLTPVRGIPRRRDQQDGDSTDLSDEDDDEPRKASRGRNMQSRPIVPDPSDVEKAMEAARRNLGMTNGSAAPGALPVTEGSALSKGSLRKAGPDRPLSPANEDSPKRRGFMGSILRRSRTYSNTSQKPPMASPPPPLPTNFAPASPRPGKLQRRTSTATQDRDYFNNNNPKTLPGEGDANWPLTPPGRLGEIRPSTSDGVSRHEQAVLLARQMRPDIGRSQSNSEGAIITGGHVGFADEANGMNGKSGAYGPKTQKKKKFGMLRRAFGLDD